MLLFVMVIVLLLTYIVTKKLALFRQGSFSHKNMKIIEMLPLAPGQYLCIVEIAKEYYVMSCTKDTIRYCFKLEEDKLNFESLQETPFDEYLKKFTKGKWEKKDENK